MSETYINIDYVRSQRKRLFVEGAQHPMNLIVRFEKYLTFQHHQITFQ